MKKKIKRRRRVVEAAIEHAPVGPVTRPVECAGCRIKGEMIEFLREQIRSLQMQNDQMANKLLALTGDAADRYQKLRVMELASQANSGPMQGVLPANFMPGSQSPIDDMPDEFDGFVSAFHDGLMSGGK